ncbi:MAG: Globin-coupled histidine kinase [Anaerolineales bacterium]|nr:Globin-coupled histidine kinase [Anaerolineales bacterium]
MGQESVRILLVEDDRADRMAVERLVRQEGLPYDLVIAETVAEAVARLKEGRLDLALIDYRLPDGSGLEVQEHVGETPCIFITGAANQAVAVQAMKAGAFDFLIKDQARDYLALLPVTIENAIRRKQDEDELRQYRERLGETVEEQTARLKEANEQLHAEIAGHRRTEAALQTKTRQQESLIEAARPLVESLDVNAVLHRVGQGAKEILDAYGCAIYLLEEDGETLTPVVAIEPHVEEEILNAPLDANVSLTGQAVHARRGLIFNDVSAGDVGQYIPGTPVYEDERVLVAPFVIGRDVLGAMCLNRLGVPFGEEDLALAETFAAHASAAVRNARAHSDLEQEVAERRRAEEALEEYSERLEEMVEERTQELRDAQDQLIRREKLAALGELAGGVGHELRNPLGVITNAVYYLNMVLSDADAKTQEYLHLIDAEAKNAASIISDLLDLARTKSANRTPSQVSKLVARVIERNPPPEDVTLKVDVPEDLPPVFVDPRQIEQVLANLVINAYQAMPEGGRLTIENCELSIDNSDTPMIAIRIRDTGAGIAPENMGKIFEPLFTTKAKGIGLGLAISKKLVEANGGQIRVESEGMPGKGTTFRVFLPIVDEAKM